MSTYYNSFLSPIGYISIQASEKAIFSISFSETPFPNPKTNSIIDLCILELHEYFNSKHTQFSVPITLIGSDFQQKVWKACEKIEYGETTSYQEIAKTIHSPKSAIAVGQALKRNPIAIIIPCHRVLNSQNKNTGYAGGIWRKNYLLSLEVV